MSKIGHNAQSDRYDANKAKAADIVGQIIEAEGDRAANNDHISSLYNKLVAMGVSKKAARMVMQFKKMKEADRASFDLAYTFMREAIGHPIQENLFQETDSRFGAEIVEKSDAPAPDASAIETAMNATAAE